jgi:ubiquinone/menaquinone biosynthesis C-methylase UbiE
MLKNLQEYYYGEIPQEGMRKFLAEAEKTSVAEAINNFLIPNFEKGKWLKKYIADDSRADWRFLLEPNPEGRVLDLGCGYGGISIPLADMFGEVVAADPTFERVETVRLRCRDEGIKNIETVQADALNLPFEDKSFDGVVMMGVLEWVAVGKEGRVEDLQQKALKEIFRVLKPHGFFVLGIENRFGYNYFLGEEDEHSHLKFTTLVPRFLANIASQILKKGTLSNLYLFLFRSPKNTS